MATINIGGKRVKVDDAFLRLSPEEQQATVDEIASQMGMSSNEPDMYASGRVKRIGGTVQRPNPNASSLPGAVGDFQNTSRAAQSGMMQGMTLGFGDELMAGLMTPIEAGIDLVQGKGFDLGRSYGKALDRGRASDANAATLNPGANLAGEIGGAFINPLAKVNLAGKATGLAKPLVGAAEGAVQGALYGAGKGETLDQRLGGAQSGALFGGAIGAVAPAIGGALSKRFSGGQQRALTNKAIKGAPSSADLKAQASQMFKAVDNSGVTIDTPKFSQFVQNIAARAKRDRINPNLDPKATGAYQELIGALGDVQQGGTALTMSDLHTLRQIAQKAATSAEGRDAMFAQRIVDGLDDFITQPGVAKLPSNRLGNPGANPNQAGNDLLGAIGTWHKARKVGLVEEAIYKAGNQASGLENGLRTQFRQLLQNKKTRSQFTAAELQAIEAVANGTGISNIVRLLGKFGFGGGSGSNMLGGTIGFGAGSVLGGPLAGVAAAILGSVARKGSEKLAQRAAERVAKVVATPNVPIYQPQMLPPSLTGGFIGAEENWRPRSIQGR